MNIPLHYSSSQLNVKIPSKNLARFIQPRHQAEKGNNPETLKQALAPHISWLRETTHDKTIGILLPDATRDLPTEDILSVLLPCLKNAQKCLFFICTGTHEPRTPANQNIVSAINTLTRFLNIENVEIIIHDCKDNSLCPAGETSRKTPIIYHQRLDAPDLFIVLSDVKHHYFAGYSNPVKNFVPGLCSFLTTEKNHSWTMDAESIAGCHPWHPDKKRTHNPLAADQLEGMQMIVKKRPVFALTTISTERQIQYAAFGEAQSVSAQTFKQVDTWNAHAVEPVDYMIISPGGLPNDVDLYIAQRALELTTSVLRDGGQLLFASACPEGIGAPHTEQQFGKPLTQSLETICRLERANYKLFSHKPLRLARLIKRLGAFYMKSEIDAGDIRRIHLTPCAEIQSRVDLWIKEDPSAKILVVDGANKLLLTAARQ